MALDPQQGKNESGSTPKLLAMSFLAAALLSIASRLVWISVVDLTEAIRPGASLDLVSVTACQLLTSLGFVLLIARLYARDESLRTLVGLRRVSVVMIVLAFVAGAAAEMPVAYVERFWAARFPLTEAQEGELGKLLAAPTLAAKVVVGVCVAVLWPIAQEVFYRGAMYGRLRIGHDARTVTFAVAAFYALSLGSPRGMPSAVLLGLGLTALRTVTGSTWAALAAHVAFMTSAVIRTFRGPDDEALVPMHAAVGAGIAACAAILVFARRSRDKDAVAGRALDTG